MKCAKLEKFLFLMVVLLLGLVLTGTAKSADPDFLGWWLLDDGAGDVAYDISSNANHGTIHNPKGGLGSGGSVWDTDPERGVVLSFNGNDTTGAYVDAGMIIPAMTLTNDFTWAFWAKQAGDGTGINDVILGNRYGASDPLQFSKFTPTKFEYYNKGNTSGFIDYQDIPDGVWLHHAIVKDGATLTYYRNGVVSGSSTITATLVAQPFYMGGDASAERWSGWLSDVRIYNHAASEAEIAEIMTGGVNRRPFVDAGDDRTVILPNDTLVLNGTVTDDGVGDPNGFLAIEWSQLSGPGAVSFEPNEFVEDPTVKFPPVLGIYILQLYATDGEKDATDTVMIAVDEPFCPVGDLNGDCRVDWQDLQIFAGRWLDDSGCSADLNGDAVVNAMDFSLLSENWLKAKAFLVINEFMASNSSGSDVNDPQGDYDDWIEIYNAGDTAINIAGMYLTDDLDEPTKWQIPSDNPFATTIPAHWYLLIWADSDTGDAGLHANFQLDATGEKIGLFDIDGSTLIDSISFSEQRLDISYGRYPNGSNNWRFFGIPTAGHKNNGAYLGLVADTKFSHDRGFYDDWFPVTITTDTNGATIHYTTDGSAPSEAHGYEYKEPVWITGTTCLRAMAFKPGWMSTNVDTQTYIFLDDVIHQPSNPSGFPSSWGSYAADYEMDPDIVNSTEYGPLINDALLSIPTVSITTDMNNLFSPSGIYSNPGSEGVAWERPTSVELIYPDGSDGFHVNCGIRIQGGYSRSASRKQSFRLLFKGMYGLTKLKYPWFGDDVVDTFDTITLRAGFNDGYGWSGAKGTEQYIRDEFGRSLQVATGHAGSHGTFVHLYVNGLYWGLYNPCERPDGSFSASYYGGDKDDWDVFSTSFEIQQGDTTALNLLLTKCRAGLSSNGAYQQIQGNNADGTPNPAYPNLIDVPNYIDYLIVNLWPGNDDWPWNNYWLARKRTSESTGFKFYCWDMEFILGKDHSTGYNLSIDRNTDFSQVAEMHYYLKQNAEYRMLFADHVHRFFFNGGILTPDSLISRYQKLADEIEMAMIAESARWGDMHYPTTPLTQQEWYNMRDWILNTCLPQRTGIVLQQFRDYGLYPNVDAPVFYINGSYQHGGYILPTDQLSMTAPAGVIYYTIDGNDPRLPGGTPNPHASIFVRDVTQVTLVTGNASKRVRVPTQTNPSTDAWRGGGSFNDSTWTSVTGSPGGIGYDRDTSSGGNYLPYISLNVEPNMYGTGKNTTCYIRIPFTVNAGDIGKFNSMTLNMLYDDGFIAYINWTEVKRANFSGAPAWNSLASASHDAGTTPTSFDISSYLYTLQVGNNILAIHGLNRSLTNNDFLITAELVGTISNVQPINLNKSTPVKSRVLSGATWSALNEAIFAIGPVAENLRITEIMYHPEGTNDPNKEFIELKNIGATALNLNLVKFTEGIHFTFPPWELTAGEYVVVVRDLDAFEDQYGTDVNVAGQYTGSLENAGERIRLEDTVGQMILDFKYKDGWRDITDGGGFSLTIINPSNPDPNSWGEKESWRASAYWGGSPGEDDSGILPNPGDVVINELLAHSHAGEPDWIELHNTTGEPINISGWFLSDDEGAPMKYQVAEDTVIDRYGYVIFREDLNFANPNDVGCLEVFRLSENGEEVCLSSAQGGVLTGYQEIQNFGASETGVSFGRYFKASINNVDFVAMSEPTPGWDNAYPKVGPIVINEIMYNPPSGSNAEFVELRNITGNKVDLFDIEGNTWKFNDEDYGIDYNLPANTSILANGYLLLVKDKANFKSWYPGVPAGVQLLEWGNGKLNNGGEKIYISMPGDVDHGERHYIRVDMINYDNKAPWPLEPDGGGKSLSRITPANYGNDPNNWTATSPTPGQ